MPFYRKIALKALKDSKYGPNQKGLFAVERIPNGEKLSYAYDSLVEEWPYYPEDDIRGKYSKAELLRLIKRHPQVENLVRFHSYMVDDDVFSVPFKDVDIESVDAVRAEKRFPQACFMNHSCDPNIIWADLKEYFAIRDIEIGEEITCHYGTVFTEDSFQNGIECKCGSTKCVRYLRMNFYKDPVWRQKYERDCVPYVKKKIQDFLRQQQSTELRPKRQAKLD